MTDPTDDPGPTLSIAITPSAWGTLGLDDSRVIADYLTKGLTFEGERATGTIDALSFLRHHASCFVDYGGAENRGTRTSMRALIRAIDRAVDAAGYEWE